MNFQILNIYIKGNLNRLLHTRPDIFQPFIAEGRWYMGRVCTEISESPKFREISRNVAVNFGQKFREISHNFGSFGSRRFREISVVFGNFGRQIFQNFAVDSAEVLNNSRTVPLKMCNFADFRWYLTWYVKESLKT